MAKLTLSDLANLTNEQTVVSTINANSALIETAMEKTLSRDGTTPNQMTANLDMNSNRILNLPAPSNATDPVRLQDLSEEEITIGVENLTAAFDTVSSVEANNIDSEVDIILVSGYAAKNDGGRAFYIREASEPAHIAKIQSLDGAWWSLYESKVDPRMVGVTMDGTTDDTDAWNDVISLINGNYYKTIEIPAGDTVITSALDTITASDWAIRGQGMDVTTINMGAASTTGNFFTLGDASNVCRRWIISSLTCSCSNQANLTGAENPFEIQSSIDGFLTYVRGEQTSGLVTVGNSALGTQSNRLKLFHCQNQAYTPAGGKAVHLQAQAGTKISFCNFGGTDTAHANFRGILIAPESADIMDTFKCVNSEWNYGTPDPLYNFEMDLTNGSIGTQIFLGCVFDQSNDGANIYIHADSGADANAWANATFIGCTSNASTDAHAIIIDNTGNAEIDVQWLDGNLTSTNEGVVNLIGGNRIDLTIANSIFTSRRSNGGSDPPYCVRIGDDVSGVKLINNFVMQRDGIGSGLPNEPYVNFIVFEGNASNCEFRGNDASNVLTSCFSNTDAWDATSVPTNICKDNKGPTGLEMGFKTSTPDANPLIVATKAIPDESVWIVTARALARRSNNSSRGYFERKALVYRDAGGSATIQGTNDTDVLTIQSDSWAFDILVSGNNCNLQLTGGAFLMNWNIEFTVEPVYTH